MNTFYKVSTDDIIDLIIMMLTQESDVSRDLKNVSKREMRESLARYDVLTTVLIDIIQRQRADRGEES
ncbi:hypothetical protein [Lacticaseibacillus saniviri]|uniref:hypothetical protein n=1 Tax=Lacticaseibacillus saniviri TaxID=931533 RepID=UPI0006CF2B06|nr:hypothetical protein [Lacticaseibacillus saniviri]